MSTRLEIYVDAHDLSLLRQAIAEYEQRAKARGEFCDAMNAADLRERLAHAALQAIDRERAALERRC